MTSLAALQSQTSGSAPEAQALFEFVGDPSPAAATQQGMAVLAPEGPPRMYWRVLVVDDDPDVHLATRYALDQVEIAGRPLQLLFAFSAAEARDLLLAEKDLALVLLDVVMETESAGLDLVGFIRDTANHKATRIVLRTGQPGYAPEFDTILKYDINDYKSKSELSHVRLLTTVTAAIRAYKQLCALESNQQGLELIVQASASFHAALGLQMFAAGVITQLAAVLGTRAEGLVCAQGDRQSGQYMVLAAAGRFAGAIHRPLQELDDVHVRALLDSALAQACNQTAPHGIVLYLGEKQGLEMAAYIERPMALTVAERHLLDVFCANSSACLCNLKLVEQLQVQAYADSLTGLPNRERFILDIDDVLRGDVAGMTLALVDIDDFGSINDLMGHAYGDQLLLAYTARLRKDLAGEPDGLTVARLGSNTFGLLGTALRVSPSVVLETVREPLVVEGAPHKIAVTSGFAALQAGLQGGDDWIKDAYLALKNAKRHSRGSHVVFTPNMGQESRARAQLLANLHAAFEQTQLFVMYQPQIDLTTRRVIGLEALVRWRTEDGRLVPPDQFIPVAEQSGLILPLGQWVLQVACDTMRRLLHEGLAPERMAVNVSVVQFQRPDFVESVLQALATSGITGHQLELEITESVAMLGSSVAESTLGRLREQGISVAVDDFGTGYSSLSYLDRLPFDRLKIDRAFVRQISDAQGPRIAEMITQLGLKLGVRIVAEGIENSDAIQVLQAMGCHEGQGFHLGRPMPYDVLVPWLAQYRGA